MQENLDYFEIKIAGKNSTEIVFNNCVFGLLFGIVLRICTESPYT